LHRLASSDVLDPYVLKLQRNGFQGLHNFGPYEHWVDNTNSIHKEPERVRSRYEDYEKERLARIDRVYALIKCPQHEGFDLGRTLKQFVNLKELVERAGVMGNRWTTSWGGLRINTVLY
jgi:hypothetical protein